jgi:Fe-S-cluster containining protein
LVTADDIARWRKTGLDHVANALQPGHFGEMAFETRPSGACIHLGTPDDPNRCAIYPDRGTVCREFQAGTRQCLEFRRRYGVARQDA